MTYQNFTLDIDADGIALVTWDMPGKSMNVISIEAMAEIAAIVERVAANPAIKGAVIASAKDTFSGGADLKMLEGLLREFHVSRRADPEAAALRLFEESRKLSLIYRRLETCGKPFVAAIHGTCLGGALELSLACHGRVMADDDKTKIGLPEVKVGIFPGAGGTQRVMRLTDPQSGLMMLLQGQELKAAKAKAMGLVHVTAPRAEIVETARKLLRDGQVPAKQPWDRPDFKQPGGKIYSPAGMQFWPAANAIYRRETADNYPGARAIMMACYEGLQMPMDIALRIESRYFAHVMQTPEAACMIRSLFVSMQDLNKGARRPAGPAPSSLKRIGVIGAGFMGAGIANVSAKAGIEVVLIDRDQEAADKGLAHIARQADDAIAKGRMKPADKDALLARVTASADYGKLADVDLVVEAVFEDRAIKKAVTEAVEAVIPPGCIFASNTSTLPITSLAANSARPDQFIGIHFFSPVEKMMLVEIIMGEKTGEEALARAMDFVKLIRKTPIVVNDARGFFANRCVLAYVREGFLMLDEGISATMVERCAAMAGMPVGPLSLSDEVGLDLSWKILQATKKDLGDGAVDPAQERILSALVVERGRQGRKNAQGFYDYPAAKGAKKQLWPGLVDILGAPRPAEAFDIGELKQRFLVAQALEAARTVEEGVVTDPREADVGSILGFGFAPYTGGTLSYIDAMGARAFVALCDKLAAKYGPRFAPTALLKEMADKRETFYGRFAPTARAA
ncbi:MAG: enoyl-CoA hydratase/isomerase family protein [Hyphomicrobiaceae bacterium]|nr:enoyl-CoA hydratase/isomerase family protein [Hyphomicrobiaceae bacterium]